MSKNKKNSGFANLNELSLQDISNGASLKENFSDKSNQKSQNKANSTVTKSLEIPTEFDAVIRAAKENKKIIGSINAYIIEALRRRMIDERLI